MFFSLFFFIQQSLCLKNTTIITQQFQQFHDTINLSKNEIVVYGISLSSLNYQKTRIGLFFSDYPDETIKFGFSSSDTYINPDSYYDLRSQDRALYYTSEYSKVYLWLKNTKSISTSFNLKLTAIASKEYDYVIFSDTPSDCISYYSSSSFSSSEADFLISSYSPSSLYYVNLNNDNQTMEININSKSSSYLADYIYAYDANGKSTAINDYGKHKGSSTKGVSIQFMSSSTDIKTIDISLTSSTSPSDYSGYYCSFSTTRSTPGDGTFRSSKKCYSPSSTSDAVIQGLVIAIAVYAAIIGVLLILNCIMACIHPNRLYRLGITCYCCYCCCTDPYYYSHTYYSAHYYHRPCFCFCGDCHCDTGSSEGNSVVIIIFLVIILLLLIFFAFILMYTLYCLCVSADEEERAWESENISRHHHHHSHDSTVIVINNPPNHSNSTPMNQSLIGNQQTNVYQPTPDYGQKQGAYQPPPPPPPQPYGVPPSPQPYGVPPPPAQPYGAPQMGYPTQSPQPAQPYPSSPYQPAADDTANPYANIDPYVDAKT